MGLPNKGGSCNRVGSAIDSREKADLTSLISHTFLPKKLPDCLPGDLVSTEQLMLRYMLAAISSTLANGITPELESTKRMFEKWVQLQPMSVGGRGKFTEDFQGAIRTLPTGDTISLYIRKQNGTLMITKIDEEKLQIRAFRSSLSCETVMSTVGSLVMDFPETNDVILNGDILASKMFASHLHELSTQVFEISMSKSNKGGFDYSEYREAADPFLLSDWIVGLLLPNATDLEKIVQTKITKKIRDEVNCKTSSSAVPFRRSGMWMSVKVALQLQIIEIMGNTQLAKIIYKCIILRMLATVCNINLK